MNGLRLKTAIGLLVAGPITANIAFLGLGVVFDYPAILRRPVDDVLAAFRADAASIAAWFVVLAIGAAILAPVSVLVGRLSDHRAMRMAVPLGVSAAAVQVIGLLRWPVLVPGLADRVATAGDGAASAAAVADFELVNRLLGTILGETLGYTLTAAWTILVLIALGRRFAGAWFVALGASSAILIALGVLAPLGIPGVDSANFIGYIFWSIWLIGFAIVLARRFRGRDGVGVNDGDGRAQPRYAARG